MFELAVDWNEAIRVSRAGMAALGPECVLVATACLAILLDLIIPRERSGPALAWVAITGAIGAFLLVWHGYFLEPQEIFWKAVVVDRFASFFKLVILCGTVLTVLLVHESAELRGRAMGEFYGLMFSAVAGMCFMVGANDMVTAFLAIELVSVPSFALVAYLRQDRRGTEASLKYVLYGAFSTGLMLFGLSILFGLTRTTGFGALSRIGAPGAASTATTVTIAVASLLAFAGFAYKMAAAPFHFWAPDVYQGASTPVTAWLSVTSKAAGIGLFTRFVAAFMDCSFRADRAPGHELDSSLVVAGFDWTTAIIVLSAVTMTIGNFGALFQTSMKRLLAYSSVAHVGYILMGLAAVQATQVGPDLLELVGRSASGAGYEAGAASQASGGAAVAFYVAAYLFMNLGAFACVIAVQNATGTDDLSGFRALGRRSPALALALATFIVALIGLPPTAGFTGKLQLFMAAIARAELRPGFWPLVAIAGVNTAVSVYYYLRVAKVMYFDGLLEPEAREPLPVSPALVIVCIMLIFPVLCFGLAFNRIVELTMGLEILRS